MVKIHNTGKTTAYLPKEKGHFAFKPGENDIDPVDLKYIKEKQGNKWDIHYSKYLCEVPENPVSDVSETVKDTASNDQNNDSDGSDNDPEGEDFGEPGVDEKSVNELKEIIDGMDKDELNTLFGSEKSRAGGPRKTVMAMIEKAMKKHESANE